MVKENRDILTPKISKIHPESAHIFTLFQEHGQIKKFERELGVRFRKL